MKYGYDLGILQSDDMTTVIAKSVENIYVMRKKEMEKVVFAEIERIATENGFDTFITLNEKAVINAFQKQIPTKPIKKNPICYNKAKDGHEEYSYDYHCPLCDKKLKLWEHHCPCGQAIDWSDTE